MGGQLARVLRSYFRRPPVVLQLSLLATFLSAGIIVLMAVGSAEILLGEGLDVLPLVYLLLAGVSVPLASGISAALGRWPVTRISGGVSLAAVAVTLALRGALALDLPGVRPAICIAAYALEIIFDTLFWLSASARLPTLELKRHTPFLAAAFGVGGILAGMIATGFCAVFASQDLLLLDAGFFALCVLQYRRIGRLVAAADEGIGEDGDPGIVESVGAILNVIRVFPITGAIAAGVLLMSALFCLQDYLAMTAYEELFQDADALASFMAIVYAGHQAAELLILAGCGRLILEGVGPVARNLLFPITTLAGLLGLSGFWSLPAAVFVHANVIAVSNAVFEPVKTLNFAALPFRALGQMRMLVDGVLYPLGVALSALGLLWLQSRATTAAILAVAIAIAIVFAAVSALVGAWFLPSLLRSLRLRAINPGEYDRLGSSRAFSARDMRRLLAHPDIEARRFGVDLARALAPELISAAAMAGACPVQAQEDFRRWPLPRADARPVPAQPAQEGTLWLRDDDYASIGEWPPAAALRPRTSRPGMRSRRADATTWRLAMITPKPSPRRLEDIGRGLEDRCIAIRRAAASLLARFGAEAVPVAAARLRCDRPEVVEAAIFALGGIGTRRAEQLLRDHLQPLYLRAQLNLDALEALRCSAGAPEDAKSALAAWLIDSNRRIVRRALVVKAALGNPRDIKLLDALRRAREPRIRSDALEALVNLSTKRFIQPLVPLLEADADAAAGPHRPETRKGVPGSAARAVRRATADDRWARLLAARLVADADRNGDRDAGAEGDEAMLDLVLFLKTTPLFRAIPLEDIARIARLAEQVSGDEGDAIVDAGDPIHHLYIVRSGTVQLRLNDRPVEVVPSGATFGEAAVFGEDRHTASFRAASQVALLRFPISIIADLVAENPEVLAPLALDLSTRLNRLRLRLAASDCCEAA